MLNLTTTTSRSRFSWLPLLLCLSFYAPFAAAESTAQKAHDFALELRGQAAAMLQKAQDRLSIAEADLRVAQAVLCDSTLANDREAIDISEAAVAEARLGVTDAQNLLKRAQALLAQREQTVQEMAFWTGSNRPVGALVVPVEGAVRVRLADGTYRSTVLGAVRAGESIETAAGGKARLFVADGSGEIQLNENTAFTVREDDGVSGFVGELQYGYGRFIKGLRAKMSGKFEVRTPSVAIAVRGTRFDVQADADSTLVRVSEGVVLVTPVAGEQAVEIVAGTQRRYIKRSGFLAPEPLEQKGGRQ